MGIAADIVDNMPSAAALQNPLGLVPVLLIGDAALGALIADLSLNFPDLCQSPDVPLTKFAGMPIEVCPAIDGFDIVWRRPEPKEPVVPKPISIFALLGLAVAGCASTGAMLEAAPDEVAQSGLPVVDVARCLAIRNNSHVLDAGEGERLVLVKTMYGNTAVAFTIAPAGPGSRVEVRRSGVYIGEIWRQCL